MLDCLPLFLLAIILMFGYSFLNSNPWLWFLWVVLGILTAAILFIIWLFFIVFPYWKRVDLNSERRYRYTVHLIKIIYYLSGVRIKVVGKENLVKDKTVLYVANHKSMVDPVTIIASIGRLCSVAAKKEVWTDMPYLAILLDSFHCLHIDRENDRNTTKEIIRGYKLMQDGYSMLIFPEGGIITRDVEQMVAIKPGCYKLATKSNSVIQPIAIHGNTKLQYRKFLDFKVTKLKVEILPPIMPEDYQELDTHEIAMKVVDKVNACYDEEKVEVKVFD